ncbi:MAG TPA: thiosulfate oxidation carrier complex protein SoxZ [Candidatus Tyrphobacter sp.]
MQNVTTRVKVPDTAAKGDIIEIKTLAYHPMVSGQGKDASGHTIPREIINTFTCQYNGKEVFRAKLEPAIASNPLLGFYIKVDAGGTFDFTWIDDDGSVYKNSASITVT